MDILEDLKWRGAINQCTDLNGLRELLNSKRFLYIVGLTQQVIRFTSGT